MMAIRRLGRRSWLDREGTGNVKEQGTRNKEQVTASEPNSRLVRIGTRGSQLALCQAQQVADVLHAHGAETHIVVIKTSGDRLGEAPLAAAGGKRLFVKEIEDALVDGRVDVAVHSAKDMPTDMPAALEIGAVLARAEPWDALVLPAGTAHGSRLSAPAESAALDEVLKQLGPAPRIGTSSVRRVTQLRGKMPGATFQPIRGNLDTRLRKLDEGQFDAIVLACAGLERLGAAHRISARLPLAVCVPAPGQGAIAVQVRRDAPEALRALVASVDHAPTHAAVTSERAVVRVLGGGCQTPIGAVALVTPQEGLELHAAVTGFDGTELRASGVGRANEAKALGERVGMTLLSEGAAELLAASAARDSGD
jgi:hydroxymethylbilane synthase